MWNKASGRAKLDGVPFDITPQDIVIPNTCEVLGIPMWVQRGKSGDHSPTLDRIIPHLGYVKGNIRVISGRANRIKSDASVDELRKVINYIERNS
jgi:hypothetical protein